MPVIGETKYCHCGQVAAYVDSVPDATLPGTHPSECGYREQPLCVVHGMERKRVATSRVMPLMRTIKCDHCGATWQDNYPNHPSDTVWCGECKR